MSNGYPPPSFKWVECFLVMWGLIAFSAFAGAEKGYFRQPESVQVKQVQQAEPAPELSETEPPAVPSVWQLMQSDNEIAAEFCGARKGN